VLSFGGVVELRDRAWQLGERGLTDLSCFGDTRQRDVEALQRVAYRREIVGI
jgi:hypothetical protein